MHQKHTKITKRETGNYAPIEIAILGAKCSVISDLVHQICQKLSNKYNLAYFDASHDNDKPIPLYSTYTFNTNGFVDIQKIKSTNPYLLKPIFNAYDLVLINGNHFEAEQQILILDNEKEASVLKRINQLSNVQCIIKKSKDDKFYDFLKEKHPYLEHLQMYLLDQIDAITEHIENIILQKIAPVNGLVLVGGKSTRMGKDKSQLQYHDLPQGEYAYRLLKEQIAMHRVFFSVRDLDQMQGEHVITDKFLGLGPFSGICSAFMKNPNVAWLVLATDVPNVNKEVINKLILGRNPKKVATCFKAKLKKFPEPLITIYEPKAYLILLNYLAQGITCPRKVLINEDVEIIEIDDDLVKNVNTPEEFDKFK